MIGYIKNLFSQRKYNKRFKNMNKHNGTYPMNVFPLEKVSIGKYSYGGIKVLSCGADSNLSIGNFCSIAGGVVFVLAAEHMLNGISTFPFKAKCLNYPANEALSKGDIIVDDDVWIGQNAIIMSGVTINQGAVIAAGAVVTSDVPPYAIVGGVPAKIIKYRFPENIIEYLLTLDYSQLDVEKINEHIELLYQPIDEITLASVKENYKWFPKK